MVFLKVAPLLLSLAQFDFVVVRKATSLSSLSSNLQLSTDDLKMYLLIIHLHSMPSLYCTISCYRSKNFFIFTSNSDITYRLASLDIQIDYNSCPLQSGKHYNLPAKLLWKDCGLYSGPSSRIQVETQHTIWDRKQAVN